MKGMMTFILLILIGFFLDLKLYAQTTTVEFTSPGLHVWTVPGGVYTVTVEAWGGGGSGAEGSGSESGGGGGGGAYAKKNDFSVVPGTSYNLFVAAGGMDMTNGEDSWFNLSTFLKAVGGNYGSTDDPGLGGTGGSASNCIGDVALSGGNGANGIYAPGGGYGGGGGSSAGTAANGNTATSRIGAIAPVGGGNGGDGGSIGGPGSFDPQSGDPPGGGGGGSRNGNDEGAGANGKILITYETPTEADLSITKTVDNPTPNVGGQITFTLTVTNLGPITATGVEVTDLLPDGYTYVSSIPSQGTYNNTIGIWDVGTITNTNSATLQIVASINAPLPGVIFLNIATITDSDQDDPDISNNSDSESVTPQQSDLSLDKSVSNLTPNVGDQVVFNITVTNQGPNGATGVIVTDLLPGGYTYVSHSTVNGTYVPGTGIWNIGAIAYPGSATLSVTVSIDAPTGALYEYQNKATITDSDQYDPDLSDNEDYAEVVPLQSDLSLAKSADNPTPGVGDLITFSIIVTNQGPDAATNVIVVDVLPNGYTYVSDDGGSATTESLGTVTWTISGSIPSGGTATLLISATVNAPGSGISYLNVAQVTDVDQWDPDSTPNDNTGDDYDTEDFTIQGSDLSLTKTVDNGTPNVGDLVTFTVTVHNAGPDAATGVVVTDALPAGLSYVSDDGGSATSESAGIITWTIPGSIGSAANLILHIVAEVEIPSGVPNEYKNIAQVTDADQWDPDSTPGDGTGDDYDDEVVSPQRSDLKVDKTVDNFTPNVGDQVVFTITVTNLGPSTATNIIATDMLDSDFTYIIHNASQGTYDQTSGIWNIGTIINGGIATLTITAKVVSAGIHSNSVSVTLEQYDPNLANNEDTIALGPPVVIPLFSWALYLAVFLMIAVILLRIIRLI
jgi:uncharacterized repeat protein (TIGR01451 family)